jgi:DNA-binding transcriptional LysR family regulator
MRAVVRHGHALARKRRVDWPELVRWPWVLQTIASPARVLLEEEFAAAGVCTPDDVIECTSIFATLQLVQSSDAVAVLPESVVRDHVEAGLLHALPLLVGQGLRAFGVLTRKDDALSDVAAAFVAQLKRSARAKSGTRVSPARGSRARASSRRVSPP